MADPQVEGKEPIIQMNFILRVDAVYDLPCKSVKNLQEEDEYEYIQEGGLNDYVHMRKKPSSKPSTFQVERYIGTGYFDPLPQGIQLKLPLFLYVSKYGGIFEKPKLTFAFTGCTVIGKSYSELNAEQSGLMIETTTIAYQQMKLTETIEEEAVKKWGFSGNSMKGNGKTSAQVNQAEVRKAKMPSRKWNPSQSKKSVGKEEKSKKKWSFSGASMKGNGKTSARVNETEVRKAAMPSRKWKQSGLKKSSLRKENETNKKRNLGKVKSVKVSSSKWSMRDYVQSGANQGRARKNPGELSKSQAEKNRRIWPEQRSARKIEDYLGKK